MRRTVVIDDRLLEEARQVLGTRTIRETIELGLREAIRRQRVQEAICAFGTIEFDLNNEELEEAWEDER